MIDSDAAAELDAIAGALARLRGRSAHVPHGAEGPHGRGGPQARHGAPESPDGDAGDDLRMRGRGPWAHGGHGGHGGWPGHAARLATGGGWPGGDPARLRLLEALAAASDPLSVGEVAEAIGVDQPRASRLIQQSVELALVRREADPDDARRTRVALTEEGSAFARRFRGQRREQLAAALAGFDPEERADLVRLLTKLAEAWPRR